MFGGRIARHPAAWIGGVGALSPTRVPDYAMRTYSGRPRSNIRFRTLVAIATSVACRPFVCERPTPKTGRSRKSPSRRLAAAIRRNRSSALPIRSTRSFAVIQLRAGRGAVEIKVLQGGQSRQRRNVADLGIIEMESLQGG